VALPTLITVQGTILKPDGTPESGKVVFTAPAFVRHGSSPGSMGPGPLRKSLDASGAVSLPVPSNTDPGWSPIGWTYQVELRLSGGTTTFPAVVPHDSPGGVLNLSSLLPVPASGGTLYAAAGHTHSDLATDAELLAERALWQAGDASVLYTASLAYDASQAALMSVTKPSDMGMVGWTFDPATTVQSATVLPTAGLSHVVRIRATAPVVTNILMHVTTPGSGLTAGQCFASLHNDAGAILGAGAVTADQSTNWASGGPKTMPMTVAQGVTVGAWYRVRFWFNGTTGPTVSRATNSNTAIVNYGLSAPNFRYSTADSGLTTAALAPQNIGTQTGGPTAWWVGLS
jgi:hypothetical protein